MTASWPIHPRHHAALVRALLALVACLFGTTLLGCSVQEPPAAGDGYGTSGGEYGTAAGVGGGDGSPDGSGEPQAWQKTTSEILFAKVSLGGGETLELKRMRVSAHVEGLRARTVVDHVFHNPFPRTLEGTFRYPLPPEATVSYFAMFDGSSEADPAFFGPADGLANATPADLAATAPDAVVASADPSLWPGAKVAKVVQAVAATQAYEKAAGRKVDPALVEQIAPNTFSARVFPIPASGSIRIVIAYEQTLPSIGDKLEYGFDLAKGPVGALDFAIAAPRTAVTGASYAGNVDGVTKADNNDSLAFAASFANASPGGRLVFRFPTSPASPQATVLAGTDPGTKSQYFVARLTPDMTALPQTEGGAAQAVFLLDTSFSEHPDQFQVNRKLLQGILESSPKLQRFNVLAFDVSARWLSPAWVTNDAAGRSAMLAKVDALLLEGSTDVGAALRALAAPPFAVGTDAHLDAFLLSDGVLDWGDSAVETMAQRYDATSPFITRFFVYRTGLAADNLELFAALTRRGAIFNCFSAADLPACSTAHQTTGVVLSAVTVEGVSATPAQAADVLVSGRQATVFPGAPITVTGRLVTSGDAIIHLQGKTSAGPVDLAVPVTLTPAGELAPRAWAEIAVTQLAQARDSKLADLAIALSQRYRVPSRLGSFLILDNPASVPDYDLEAAQAKLGGKTLDEALKAAFAALGAGVTSWDRLSYVFNTYGATSHVLSADGGKLVSKVKSLVPATELELPLSTLAAPVITAASVPPAYVSAMRHDPDVATPFVDEAERRRGAGDVPGAVRALSTLVENNPSDAEVERLIGYRIGSWKQEPLADSLFLHVLERRPFEPQSYRDLANSLWTARPGLSALLFEAAIQGEWAPKFALMKPVVEEEYSMLIRALAKKSPSDPLVSYLQGRKKSLGLPDPVGDLRVTLTWNTDQTDIDLWVTDPKGEKCFYSNPKIASGGELLADLTQGYGPERFQAINAIRGTYKVQVHYFGNNSNQLVAETYVIVTVTTHVGTPLESVQRFNVMLPRVDEVTTITTVTF